jgi:MFS transporter, SP family, arabinose:H+ symporter
VRGQSRPGPSAADLGHGRPELFPVMNQYFGLPVTFLIHAAICLVYFFFIRTSIPETKGRTLEEIEKLLQKS